MNIKKNQTSALKETCKGKGRGRDKRKVKMRCAEVWKGGAR